jgi:drug/metabolite transporter (DMT)-like permease
MSNLWRAHLALFSANLIYGANYTIAKVVMPDFIKPSGFIFLRALSALILFSISSLFIKSTKIENKDWPRIIACGIFGVTINQLLFFKGLSLTSPIHAAIMMVCTPIIVLILSSLSNREKLNRLKLFGVIAGFIGASILIVSSGTVNSVNNGNMLGDFCVLLNAISWGVYLILAKPLMKKYNAIHLVKWVFLFGFIFVFPFGWNEFLQVNWANLPTEIILRVVFVIIGSTFLAYLLNTMALKWANPSLVSGYIYLQPLLAAAIAIILGVDTLNYVILFSAIFIFSGVYMIGKKNHKESGVKAKAV